MGPQGWKGVFVSYMGWRGYHISNPERKKVFQVRDVVFEEGVAVRTQSGILKIKPDTETIDSESEITTEDVPGLPTNDNMNPQ